MYNAKKEEIYISVIVPILCEILLYMAVVNFYIKTYNIFDHSSRDNIVINKDDIKLLIYFRR